MLGPGGERERERERGGERGGREREREREREGERERNGKEVERRQFEKEENKHNADIYMSYAMDISKPPKLY